MRKITVYVATISHRHGDNVYVSRTEEGLNKQVANFCREWWHEIDDAVTIPKDDNEVIELYFSEEYKGYLESVTFLGDAVVGE